jgi:hypothetical protein
VIRIALQHQTMEPHRLRHPRWSDLGQRHDIVERAFAQQLLGFAVERSVEVVMVIRRRTGMMGEQAMLAFTQNSAGRRTLRNPLLGIVVLMRQVRS